MATLVTSGRAGLAASVKARNIFLGIGSGDATWDTNGAPAEAITATALTTAIGYRKHTQVDHVVEDVNGSISVPSGRYEISSTETNLLYLKFNMDFQDASTDTIRETGIFLDTVTDPNLPAGQMFFSAATEIQATGTLYLLEHVAAIIRTAATRETFEFVLEF